LNAEVRWQDIGDIPCSVARALSVVGDRWTLLILRDCFLGSHRFDQFAESLDLSPHLLSTRLSKLVDHGILERRPYRERPLRHEYRLTGKGLDLYPVIAGLLRWGDRWMADDGELPLTLVHRSCGHTTQPELRCSECGDAVGARDLRAVPAPPQATTAPGESHRSSRRNPS
jgi:DNA-binding HxlR family transcriptional regulator